MLKIIKLFEIVLCVPRFSKISLGFRAPPTHLDQFFLAATLNLFIIIKPAR